MLQLAWARVRGTAGELISYQSYACMGKSRLPENRGGKGGVLPSTASNHLSDAHKYGHGCKGSCCPGLDVLVLCSSVQTLRFQGLHTLCNGATFKSSTLTPTLAKPRRYGSEQGPEALRAGIAKTFYKDIISADEVFMSDGSKCDIGRLQMMFGTDTTVAAQVRALPPSLPLLALSLSRGRPATPAGTAGLFSRVLTNVVAVLPSTCICVSIRAWSVSVRAWSVSIRAWSDLFLMYMHPAPPGLSLENLTICKGLLIFCPCSNF